MKRILTIVTLSLVLISLKAHSEIPVLSVDSEGNEIAKIVSDNEYEQIMSLTADTSAQAAEDHLNQALVRPHLRLKGILVGLEALGSIGLGPFKIGAGINQQFYFELIN